MFCLYDNFKNLFIFRKQQSHQTKYNKHFVNTYLEIIAVVNWKQQTFKSWLWYIYIVQLFTLYFITWI